MSKKYSILLGLASFALAIFLVGCSYHHDYDRYHNYGYGYGNYAYNGYSGGVQQAYQSGYQRGYDHGTYDRRNGYRFDYRDDDVYRSGVSRDGYINSQFRNGYERGYRDAYSGLRGY